MSDWVSHFFGALRTTLRRRNALVLENLLLRQQLAVVLRARPRPRLRRRDRVFWVLARQRCADWRRHLVLVRPATVLRWHRRSWRLFWWWRSGRPTGRPRVPQGECQVRAGGPVAWGRASRNLATRAVPPAPLPGRDHQPLHVALLPLPVSYRDVEGLLAERGVVVSYETIRQWCRKFGPVFAAGLRRRRSRPGDKWHMDELVLKINGKRHWLWRAVDQDGIVLDILVQPRRSQEAAESFLRRVVGGCGYQPRVVITDKVASYPPAVRRVLPRAEHRRHKGLNNRAENSHRPTRRRERALQRFKSPAHAQQFLSPFGPISDHFRPRRHRLPAPRYRQMMQTRFAAWREVTELPAAA